MKKIVKNIANGDKGIDQTVSEMWRLINRDLSNPIAINKANSLRKASNEDTVKAIFDYVWQTVPYVSDPETAEQLTAPIHLITGEKKGEDCDGLVMLLANLLLINKFEVRIRTIAWRIYQFTHVVLDVKLNDKWIGLDATRKASGYDFKMNIIREKIYYNDMGKLITLEDNFNLSSNCGCKKKNPTNQNIINIGNDSSSRIDESSRNMFRNIDLPDNYKLDNQKEVEQKIVTIPVEKKVVVPFPAVYNKKKTAKFYPAYY